MTTAGERSPIEKIIEEEFNETTKHLFNKSIITIEPKHIDTSHPGESYRIFLILKFHPEKEKFDNVVKTFFENVTVKGLEECVNTLILHYNNKKSEKIVNQLKTFLSDERNTGKPEGWQKSLRQYGGIAIIDNIIKSWIVYSTFVFRTNIYCLFLENRFIRNIGLDENKTKKLTKWEIDKVDWGKISKYTTLQSMKAFCDTIFSSVKFFIDRASKAYFDDTLASIKTDDPQRDHSNIETYLEQIYDKITKANNKNNEVAGVDDYFKKCKDLVYESNANNLNDISTQKENREIGKREGRTKLINFNSKTREDNEIDKVGDILRNVHKVDFYIPKSRRRFLNFAKFFHKVINLCPAYYSFKKSIEPKKPIQLTRPTGPQPQEEMGKLMEYIFIGINPKFPEKIENKINDSSIEFIEETTNDYDYAFHNEYNFNLHEIKRYNNGSKFELKFRHLTYDEDVTKNKDEFIIQFGKMIRKIKNLYNFKLHTATVYSGFGGNNVAAIYTSKEEKNINFKYNGRGAIARYFPYEEYGVKANQKIPHNRSIIQYLKDVVGDRHNYIKDGIIHATYETLPKLFNNMKKVNPEILTTNSDQLEKPGKTLDTINKSAMSISPDRIEKNVENAILENVTNTLILSKFQIYLLNTIKSYVNTHEFDQEQRIIEKLVDSNTMTARNAINDTVSEVPQEIIDKINTEPIMKYTVNGMHTIDLLKTLYRYSHGDRQVFKYKKQSGDNVINVYSEEFNIVHAMAGGVVFLLMFAFHASAPVLRMFVILSTNGGAKKRSRRKSRKGRKTRRRGQRKSKRT